MAKKPLPLSVLEGRGKKHLTKKEKEERRKAEESLQPGTDKIEAPDWLDDIAKEEWDRIIDELKSLNIATNIDVGTLAVCCDAYSKYVQATLKVQEEGLLVYHTNKSGATNLVKNPAAQLQKQYADMYRQYMSEFGLSPSSRLKLVLPSAEQEEPKSEAERRFGDRL